jgi:energy-coupling factor transporter ATP-binding protein EcfA2
VRGGPVARIFRNNLSMSTEPDHAERSVKVELSRLDFHNSVALSIPPGSITIIAGPNNSGKSIVLKEIFLLAARRPQDGVVASMTVEGVHTAKSVTFDDLVDWMLKNGVRRRRVAGRSHATFYTWTGQFQENMLRMHWEELESLGEVAHLAIGYQSTENRLRLTRSEGGNDPEAGESWGPLQLLSADREAEERLSDLTRRAFGVGICVNRYSGNNELKVGRPSVSDPGPPASPELAAELDALRSVSSEGDGFRSFVGLLLHVFAPHYSVVLVDEPEAFLHPPQARLLAQFLVDLTAEDRQLVLATHSQDVLQGALEAAASRPVQIVRLTRPDAGHPDVSILDPDLVRELIDDPLLYHSNILNGLFHDAVIICEADADCMYYRASILAQFRGLWLPDFMYLPVAGKHRVASVTRKLRKLSVPCACIVDFDIFNEEMPFRALVDAYGGRWAEVEGDYKRLCESVEDPFGPTVQSVRDALKAASSGMRPADRLGSERIETLKKALKATTGWKLLKTTGVHGVEQGAPAQAADRLLAAMHQIGIFPVPVGELERWHRQVNGHSGPWVSRVLEANLHLTAHPERSEFLNSLVRHLCGKTGKSLPEAPADTSGSDEQVTDGAR